jgi:hypothetical protein
MRNLDAAPSSSIDGVRPPSSRSVTVARALVAAAILNLASGCKMHCYASSGEQGGENTSGGSLYTCRPTDEAPTAPTGEPNPPDLSDPLIVPPGPRDSDTGQEEDTDL